jgi:hypothetical protein
MQLSKRDVIPNQVQDNNNSNNLGTKKKKCSKHSEMGMDMMMMLINTHT